MASIYFSKNKYNLAKKTKNNEILQWNNRRITFCRHERTLTQKKTTTTTKNKSTKVWLNSWSKYKWKLKYKRWQNNCFVVTITRWIRERPLRAATPYQHPIPDNIDSTNNMCTAILTIDYTSIVTLNRTNISRNVLVHTSRERETIDKKNTTHWPPAAAAENIKCVQSIILPSSILNLQSVCPGFYIIAKIIPRTRFLVVIHLHNIVNSHRMRYFTFHSVFTIYIFLFHLGNFVSRFARIWNHFFISLNWIACDFSKSDCD